MEPIGPHKICASSYGLCVLVQVFMQILPVRPDSPEFGRESGPASYISVNVVSYISESGVQQAQESLYVC